MLPASMKPWIASISKCASSRRCFHRVRVGHWCPERLFESTVRCTRHASLRDLQNLLNFSLGFTRLVDQKTIWIFLSSRDTLESLLMLALQGQRLSSISSTKGLICVFRERISIPCPLLQLHLESSSLAASETLCANCNATLNSASLFTLFFVLWIHGLQCNNGIVSTFSRACLRKLFSCITVALYVTNYPLAFSTKSLYSSSLGSVESILLNFLAWSSFGFSIANSCFSRLWAVLRFLSVTHQTYSFGGVSFNNVNFSLCYIQIGLSWPDDCKWLFWQLNSRFDMLTANKVSLNRPEVFLSFRVNLFLQVDNFPIACRLYIETYPYGVFPSQSGSWNSCSLPGNDAEPSATGSTETSDFVGFQDFSIQSSGMNFWCVQLFLVLIYQ